MNKYEFIKKEIAYEYDIMAIEDLPFSIVLYPTHGAFFAFREKRDFSPITLCSCAKKPIENYIRLRTKYRLSRPNEHNINRTREFILDSYEFPLALVNHLIHINAPSDERVIDYLEFKDNLCHECNKKIPSYRFCNEIYGGIFTQTYGWYIRKAYYEFGIGLGSYLEDVCPEEFKRLLNEINENRNKYQEEYLSWINLPEDTKFVNNRREEADKLRRIVAQPSRKLHSTIENYVRRKFGYKNVGESWLNETLLFNIIKQLHPNLTVHFHYRPEWLEGLEVDVFIEELQTAIEYQGMQHYKPMKHWGGEAAFNALQMRDKKKKEICYKHNIRLLYFRYDEDLSKESVENRLLRAEK